MLFKGCFRCEDSFECEILMQQRTVFAQELVQIRAYVDITECIFQLQKFLQHNSFLRGDE